MSSLPLEPKPHDLRLHVLGDAEGARVAEIWSAMPLRAPSRRGRYRIHPELGCMFQDEYLKHV